MQNFPNGSDLPTPSLLGYARVSTDDQDPQMQIDALLRAGVMESNIYRDTASGGSMARPALKGLLRDLRAGDVVVIWKFDRLSRRLVDLLELVRYIHRRGARFRSLTEAIDTSGPMGELMLHVFGSFAQFERAMIRERTRAGLARARAQGRVGGRRPTFTDEQIRAAIKARSEPGVTWQMAADSIGISIPSLQRRIRQLCPTN